MIQPKDLVPSLGLTTNGNVSSKNWLSILCPNPSHNDKNYGNASINLDTGAVKCFSCGYSNDMIGLVMDVRGCSFKEAKEYLGQDSFISFGKKKRAYGRDEARRKANQDKKATPYEELILSPFNPDHFEYTRQRGYTREFLDYWNIQLCTKGYYNDFLIIPLPEGNTYEARKLKEREYFTKLFPGSESVPLGRLRTTFKNQKHDLTFLTRYLMKGKTLYPVGEMLDKPFIFGQSRLLYDQDLYLTEGTASLPKIWTHISRNCTCTFGSEISEKQLKILRRFLGRIIVVPDNDHSGHKMVQTLTRHLYRVNAIPIDVEDTSSLYVDKLKTGEIIESSRYLIRLNAHADSRTETDS